MKRNSSELKRLARQHLNGRYGIPIGGWLVCGLITGCMTGIFTSFLNIYASLRDIIFYYLIVALVSLISILLSSGMFGIHLAMSRGRAYAFSDLFSCFRMRPDRFILGQLLIMGILLVCFLPCILCLAAGILFHTFFPVILAIPLALAGMAAGILATLPLALIFVLLVDHPQMDLTEAVRESRRLMQGRKGSYFYLQLSFLGWSLLGVLSCYIGFLWIEPYISQTTIEFYLDAVGEPNQPTP